MSEALLREGGASPFPTCGFNDAEGASARNVANSADGQRWILTRSIDARKNQSSGYGCNRYMAAKPHSASPKVQARIRVESGSSWGLRPRYTTAATVASRWNPQA